MKGKYKKKYSKLKGGASSAVDSRVSLIPPNPSNPDSSSITTKPLVFKFGTYTGLSEEQKILKQKIEELERQIKTSINDFIFKEFVMNESDKLKSVKLKQNFITSLEIVELTNTFCQIKYNYYDINGKYMPIFIIIKPDILSVDKLQYFVNNDKLSITPDNNIQISENTLVLQILKTGGQTRTGNNNNFITVYEDSNINMIPYRENLENLKHNRFLINVKDVNNIVKPFQKSLIKDDITWLKAIMDDLNTKDETGKKRIDLFLEKSTTVEGKTDYMPRIFTCADLNVDHSKIIIEDKDTGIDANGNPNKLMIGNEEYVIIGYPKDTMRPYIDLYNKHKAEFDAIYEDHKRDFMKYMVGLHNTISENKIDIEKLSDEIYKFYGYENYYKYIEDFYKNNEDKFSDYELVYDPDFQNKFKNLQKEFYSILASKCLNKPMMNINYVFLIFKKQSSDSEYVPAIFNFRELTNEHHKIFKRLEYCIKTRLSKIYGVTDDIDEDKDYKLYYSHYNYGDVFHIKTEYIHTMSNIQQQAYKYSNSITLEEIIYILSFLKPRTLLPLYNLKVEYKRKKPNFLILNDNKTVYNYDQSITEKLDPKYKLNIELNQPIKSILPFTTFIDSNMSKLEEESNTNLDELDKYKHTDKCKILLMFVQTGKIYTFVYKQNEIFYIIKIKQELHNSITKILEYLKNTINIFSQKNIEDILKKRDMEYVQILDTPNINLYTVLEHRQINKNDYKSIIRYNPLLVRTIKKRTTDPKITISDLFISPLVDNLNLVKKHFLKEDFKIPNPYSKKPILIRNFLSTDTYISEFDKFKEKIRQNPNATHLYPNDNLNEKCSEESLSNKQSDKDFELLYNKNENHTKFNRIFFNPGNCRYNFIEMCEKNKRVIWILPLNATDCENLKEDEDNLNLFKNNIPIYLGNFTSLNITHIPMLNQLIKLFNNETLECFFNIGSILPKQYSIHSQVFNRKLTYYDHSIATLQQGSRINNFVNINTFINLLNLGYTCNNYQYFNNEKYHINLLIHDKP